MLAVTEIDWIGDRLAPISKATRLEVERKVKEVFDAGKLPEIDYADLEDLGQLLAEKGDILLYPNKKNIDEVNVIFDRMTDAIALLSFVKSGVELFGYRYEAVLDGSSETRLYGKEVRNADGFRKRRSHS